MKKSQRKLKAPSMEGVLWKRDRRADKIISDAIKIAVALRDIKGNGLKRKIFDTLIWNITVSNGAEGKYDTRYYTKKAMKEGAARRHEHVFERKFLIDKLIKAKTRREIEKCFNHAIACVVIPAEHTLLSKLKKSGGSAQGWERYSLVPIEVIDRKPKNTKLANLRELQNRQKTFCSDRAYLIK